MSLMTVTLAPTTADHEWPEVAAPPFLDDWLRLIWGTRPGVGSPPCIPGPVHPSCAAAAGWLRALWNIG
jgi:hypothetical protein